METLTKKERRELARGQKREEREKEKKTMFGKKIATWVLVIAGLGFLGYRFFVWLSTPAGTKTATETITISEVTDADWVTGAKDAKVTLVEYADFQCPACAAYHPFVKSLLSENPDSLRVVFRHFPLTNIHPNALSAAHAAEAAGAQGKFWEMGDILFAKQEEWASSDNATDLFKGYANELGLDVDKFASDMDSDIARESVTSDLASGNQAGINSTPTFVLNGQRVILTNNVTDFVAAVTNAISQ